MIEFCKMQAAGNDYIYLDEASTINVTDWKVFVRKMCDRHFGIGGDGVVTIDWKANKMIMYNADGSRGVICGNALRSVAHLAYLRYGREEIVINTDVGPRRVKRTGSHYVAEMGKGKVLQNLHVEGVDCDLIDVGNLHVVTLDARLSAKDVCDKIEQAYLHLRDMCNTEVVTLGQDVCASVFERGTGYTMSCGSGACAIAVCLWQQGIVDPTKSIEIKMPGGTLVVSQREGLLYLEGDAKLVAEGKYYA